MYVRVKRFRNKDGSVREYLYIVKGVRVDGKPRQKVVAYLGRLDDLQREGAIDSLVEGLAYKGLWRVEAAFREPQMPLRVTRDGFWGRSTTGPGGEWRDVPSFARRVFWGRMWRGISSLSSWSNTASIAEGSAGGQQALARFMESG